MQHGSLPVDHYRQGDIALRVNRDPAGFAPRVGKLHGPSICSMDLHVSDSAAALSAATSRGSNADTGDHLWDGHPLAVVCGNGVSLIDFVEGFARADHWERLSSPSRHLT